MNADVKEKWLEALRSGHFQQGRCGLRPTPDTHCCLGVLCELHRRAHPDSDARWNRHSEEGDPQYYASPSEFSNGVLPAPVVLWAGLKESNPAVMNCEKNPPRRQNLADCNDSGYSFADIANFIEESL